MVELSSAAQTWRDQRERRFHLERDAAERVLAVILRNAPEVHYGGSDTTTVVTTYLDSKERHYLALAEDSDGERSLKMRIREYLSSGRVPDAHCYLERKQRDGDVRLKQRIRVRKADVVGMVLGDDPVPAGSVEADAIRAEIERYKLRAVLVSAYERRVFGSDDRLRITFDERVAFYRPPRGLYNLSPALTPKVLGPPLARGPSRILEVKHPTGAKLPPWLADALAGLPGQPRYSKFRDGMRALSSSDGSPVDLTRRVDVRKLKL